MEKNQMTLIKAIGIEKSFNTRKVLDQVQFEIKQGERIGLVGYNGTGKTTLANMLAGRLAPDRGMIEKAPSLKTGYLSQSVDYKAGDLTDSFQINSGSDLFQFASELGLKKIYEWEENRLNHLSGGEKLKLALSMIWASKPGFLILDEPTNHLDFQGIRWLIDELKKFPGAVLIISHDRHFLDQTVTKVFEIEHGKLHFYHGNYSEYREEKQKRFENQQHQYKVQQRKKEEIDAQMEQLKSWSNKAHRASTKEEGFKEYHRVKAKKRDAQVKSKMKRLEKELEKNKVEKPIEDAKIRFQFDSQGKRGKRIIEANNLAKSFNQRTLFHGSQFYMNQGERIGLLGENGCGKTTLIKMILEEESASAGTLWRSESIKIAYLSQDAADLPEAFTALEVLGLTDREDIFRARTLFANLGLTEAHITKPIHTLSLGERTRVKLVDLLMKEYDILILDEPTNHLDLPSREQLEATLHEFSGTIIVVSHDYYFLNKLCEKVLIFEGQQIKRIEMKPEEYFNRKKQDDTKEALLVLENRIAAILGEISLMDPKNPEYQVLDQEFHQLLKQKRNLLV